VIRKHIGYGHHSREVRREGAEVLHGALQPVSELPPAVRLRPRVEGARGKRRKVYRSQDYMTPYEKLKSLPQAEKFLKPGIRLESLERRARRMSDTASGQKMRQAKAVLLRAVKLESPTAPRD